MDTEVFRSKADKWKRGSESIHGKSVFSRRSDENIEQFSEKKGRKNKTGVGRHRYGLERKINNKVPRFGGRQGNPTG